jgi:peptidoglycan/LPS O-acetylase OafA/YrhL
MKIENPKTQPYKHISIFPGLNSLRFIAAFLVVMHHSETIKRKNGIVNFEWLGLFRNGGNAVTFFFVLSGFLITYLLLKERDKMGSINVKKFYFKRILRIWPLYFMLVFIGTIGLPLAFKFLNVSYEMPYNIEQTWFYFLFFLPGLVTFFFGHHFLEPLWSIGVEEVFYLIWAPLFKINKRKIFTLLIWIIAVKSFLSLLGILIIHNDLFNYIVNTFKFEAMAIGGLGAYFLYNREASINQLLIFKVPIQIIVFFTVILHLTFHSNINNVFWNTLFKTPIMSPILVDFLFLYVIICVSVVDTSIIKLRNRTLSFLGEISYGVYMYHMLVIFGTLLFLKEYLIQMSSPWNHIVFYSLVTVFTITVSILSKYLFENFFLKLKEKLK